MNFNGLEIIASHMVSDTCVVRRSLLARLKKDFFRRSDFFHRPTCYIFGKKIICSPESYKKLEYDLNKGNDSMAFHKGK